MELELHRTQMAGFDLLLDTTVSHEETLEMIVPDAYPDILRIVDTDACVCLKGKEAADGRAELAGIIRAAVVYCPDGAHGMRRLELNLPFRVSVDLPGLRPGCPLTVQPRVKTAETRLLNPRKVLLRADIAIELQAWAPVNERVCTELIAEAHLGLQQLSETRTAYLVTAVQEKSFTYADDVSISGSRPAAEELLNWRVDTRCNESKVIGNKLIFKGEASVYVLYRATGGALCSGRWELPFSQIMEVTGIEEEAECELQITVTQSDLTIANAGGEGRSLSVALGLTAQAVVREERRLTMVSDAYATAAHLAVEVKQYNLHRRVDGGTLRQTVRDILDPGISVKAVEDAYARIGHIERTREAEETVLTAEVLVTVLCTDDDDELYAVTRPMTAAVRLKIPEEAECRFRCVIPEGAIALPTAEGVEVRLAVEFQTLTTAARRYEALSGARAEELPVQDAANRPSIILRMPARGERLWDIAKAYNTTIDEILSANELDDPPIAPDTLLLIPQRR